MWFISLTMEIRFSAWKSTYVNEYHCTDGVNLQVIIVAKGKHISITCICDFLFRGTHILRHTKEQG